MRAVSPGTQWPAVTHDPEYERFIQQTGFQFERDLDQAAFAVRYPANWPGGGTGVRHQSHAFSEVLVGKFQGQNLTTYLKQVAQSVENYHSVDIFTVPLEGRSLRVAVLNVDSIAASNHGDPAVIRGIVGPLTSAWLLPLGGPAFLRQYYRHVQFGSLAWVAARVQSAAPGSGDGLRCSRRRPKL